MEAIARNKEFNAAHSTEAAARMEKVVPSSGDVRMVMMQHEKLFDAVDIDPYGTPSILLDGAVQVPTQYTPNTPLNTPNTPLIFS